MIPISAIWLETRFKASIPKASLQFDAFGLVFFIEFRTDITDEMESIASDGKMVLGFFLLFKDHVIQLAKLHMDRCDIGEKYLSERCQLDPTVGTGKQWFPAFGLQRLNGG